MKRIESNQPQAHFNRQETITVMQDTTVHGKSLSGYVYRQGERYMILYNLQEALYLSRMGFNVELGQGLE